MTKKPPFLNDNHMPRKSANGRRWATREQLLELMERRRAAGLILPELPPLKGHTDLELTQGYLSSHSPKRRPSGRRPRAKTDRLTRGPKP